MAVRLSLTLNSIHPPRPLLNMPLSYKQLSFTVAKYLFLIQTQMILSFWSSLALFLVQYSKTICFDPSFWFLIKKGPIVFYVIRTLALVPSPNSLTQALWQLIQRLEPRDSDDLFCLFVMISTSSLFSLVSACNVCVDLHWSSKTCSSNSLTL